MPTSLKRDQVLIPISASLFGFVSGLLTSSKLSSRQFLAENAHRLPTTVQGWYFYQKTKNYRVMFGGIKGGLKTGGTLGAWTLGFVGILEGIESTKSKLSVAETIPSRWASGTIAGTALGGVAALLYRLPRAGGIRRLLMAGAFGLTAGAAQDLRDYVGKRLPVEIIAE